MGALAEIDPTEPLVLKTAREWLKREDSPRHIEKGVGLVFFLGTHGTEAIPDLIAVLVMKPLADKSVDKRIKLETLSILEKMGPAARRAVPTLRAMNLTMTDVELRQQLAETILTLENKN